MQNKTNQLINADYLALSPKTPPAVGTSGAFHPPLETITRPNVDTAAAAYYLNRKQQTLRGWACFDNGPIRPLRICGRLAWPVQRIKELTGTA